MTKLLVGAVALAHRLWQVAATIARQHSPMAGRRPAPSHSGSIRQHWKGLLGRFAGGQSLACMPFSLSAPAS